MNALLRLIDRLTLLGAWGAAFLILALFGLGLTEIVARTVFDYSLTFAAEYSGYMLACSFFLGSAWTLGEGGHIRVNLLLSRLDGRQAWAVDLLCSLLALALAGFMAYALTAWSVGTFQWGEVSYYPSETPLYLPQALFATGPCLLTLALFARCVRLLRGEEQP